MKVEELLASAQETITGKSVFSEPYERDGVTVITAATISGGGGGGGGPDPQGREGAGLGYGLSGRPAGVYVIRDGDVRWQPAVDVNRLFARVAAVAIVYLLTRWRVERYRCKA